jgi:hypothetical protein
VQSSLTIIHLTSLFRQNHSMKTSKIEKLAEELADTLSDQDSLSFYCDLVEKYSETFLRGYLKKVMSIPSDQIRKTRGALFTYLIKQHERRYDPRG